MAFGFHSCLSDAGELHADADVLQRGAPRQQPRVLEDDGYLAAEPVELGVRVVPLHAHRALRRCEQPEGEVEHRRLAAAGDAHDGDELALTDREVEVVERPVPGKRLVDVVELDDGLTHVLIPSRPRGRQTQVWWGRWSVWTPLPGEPRGSGGRGLDQLDRRLEDRTCRWPAGASRRRPKPCRTAAGPSSSWERHADRGADELGDQHHADAQAQVDLPGGEDARGDGRQGDLAEERRPGWPERAGHVSQLRRDRAV